MLTICTWRWGSAFTDDYVAKLAAGVRRNLQQPHRFVCFSDRRFQIDGVEDGVLPDIELTKVPGCFARLRMFDTFWQKGWFSDRLVCIDLDTVVVGPLDPLFDRAEPFVIMQGGNSANPNPYGGALVMLRANAYPEVWTDFSVEAAAKVPYYAFPDDQSWLRAKIPDAGAWKVGPESGVYCFKKPGWSTGDDLPRRARLVTFRGNNLPSKHRHLKWVRENWR